MVLDFDETIITRSVVVPRKKYYGHTGSVSRYSQVLLAALENPSRGDVTSSYIAVIQNVCSPTQPDESRHQEQRMQDYYEERRRCLSLVAVHSEWYDAYYCKNSTRKLYTEYRELVREVGVSEAYNVVEEDVVRYWGKMLRDHDIGLEVVHGVIFIAEVD